MAYIAIKQNIKACAQQLLERFNGEVPQTRDELVSWRGEKTANVVMGDAFGEPAFAVDTHVERVSKRLRICKLNANVTEVEQTQCVKFRRTLGENAPYHDFLLALSLPSKSA